MHLAGNCPQSVNLNKGGSLYSNMLITGRTYSTQHVYKQVPVTFEPPLLDHGCYSSLVISVHALYHPHTQGAFILALVKTTARKEFNLQCKLPLAHTLNSSIIKSTAQSCEMIFVARGNQGNNGLISKICTFTSAVLLNVKLP